MTRLGWLGLLLAVVLSAYVVWPAGWLVRNLRGRPVALATSTLGTAVGLVFGSIAAAP
ncbi:MAG: hypothetical protein R2854_16780 [Caldilineaceae bacterium]